MPTNLNFILRSNILVILADTHNPSLLTDLFLQRSGIIDSENEIIRESFIITPGLASVVLKKGSAIVSITLDPGTLKIESGNSDLPFQIGDKYCKTLPHIVGKAFGINLIYLVRMPNADQWFSEKWNSSYPGAFLKQMVIQLQNENQIINVTVSNMGNQNIEVKFNFHNEINKVALGAVQSFINLRKRNEAIALDTLNNIFV